MTELEYEPRHNFQPFYLNHHASQPSPLCNINLVHSFAHSFVRVSMHSNPSLKNEVLINSCQVHYIGKYIFSLRLLKLSLGDGRRWILYLLTFDYQENTLSPTFISGTYLVLVILAKNGIDK